MTAIGSYVFDIDGTLIYESPNKSLWKDVRLKTNIIAQLKSYAKHHPIHIVSGRKASQKKEIYKFLKRNNIPFHTLTLQNEDLPALPNHIFKEKALIALEDANYKILGIYDDNVNVYQSLNKAMYYYVPSSSDFAIRINPQTPPTDDYYPKIVTHAALNDEYASAPKPQIQTKESFLQKIKSKFIK